MQISGAVREEQGARRQTLLTGITLCELWPEHREETQMRNYLDEGRRSFETYFGGLEGSMSAIE
jgi:hypothetical protein